jgi:hypothetical protein
MGWSRLQAACALGCSEILIIGYELNVRRCPASRILLAAYIEEFAKIDRANCLLFEIQEVNAAAVEARKARLRAKWAFDPEATAPPALSQPSPTEHATDVGA